MKRKRLRKRTEPEPEPERTHKSIIDSYYYDLSFECLTRVISLLLTTISPIEKLIFKDGSEKGIPCEPLQLQPKTKCKKEKGNNERTLNLKNGEKKIYFIAMFIFEYSGC